LRHDKAVGELIDLEIEHRVEELTPKPGGIPTPELWVKATREILGDLGLPQDAVPDIENARHEKFCSSNAHIFEGGGFRLIACLRFRMMRAEDEI
jgi:hypothetical protein